MQKIALIVPCHNEAKTLNADAFNRFITANEHFTLFFINDGSVDNTGELLKALRQKHPDRAQLITNTYNEGKAASIRKGVIAAMEYGGLSAFGYLDADLSTSLHEFKKLVDLLNQHAADYILGSRIKMLHTKIERSGFRHFVGRLIATIIDSRYRLGIYDTQCGAKCFSMQFAILFNEPFVTRWFFDIEILLRMRKLYPDATGIEQPLTHWRDPGSSHLNILSFPLIAKECISLFSHYPKP